MAMTISQQFAEIRKLSRFSSSEHAYGFVSLPKPVQYLGILEICIMYALASDHASLTDRAAISRPHWFNSSENRQR